MPLPLGSVGPPRRGCHLLREPQPHTLPGRGDLDPLLLALPVPVWVTHGPAPTCCQAEPRSSEGPQGPTGGSGGLSVCGWRLWTLSSPGWGQDMPPTPQEADWGTPQPVDLGTKRPNFQVMWPLAKPTGANCSHQLQCLSCVTGGPRGRGAAGGPRGMELQLAGPPWGHNNQLQPPTAGRLPGLGEGACSPRCVGLP